MSSVLSLPSTSNSIINDMNYTTSEYVKKISLPASGYNPPSLTPLLVNNCNSYSNEISNTNQDCLMGLIEACDINIVNQNNNINYSNCINIQDYNKSYGLEQETKIKNQLDWYMNNGYQSWAASNVDCTYWNSETLDGCTTYCIQDPSRTYPLYPPSPGATGTAQQGNCSTGWGDCWCTSPNYSALNSWYYDLEVTQRYIKSIDNYICDNPTQIPMAAIDCCNNKVTCPEFAECINIVQMCVLGANGESEISNAVQCMLESCPLNGQKCIAGAEGSEGYNWVCQENKWVSPPPSPPAPPPAPPAPSPSPSPPLSPVPPPPAPSPPVPKSRVPSELPISKVPSELPKSRMSTESLILRETSESPIIKIQPIKTYPIIKPEYTPIRIFKPSINNQNKTKSKSKSSSNTIILMGGVIVIVIIVIFIIFYNML